MSIFGKLFKKKDDFSFDDKEFSVPPGSEDPLGTPKQSQVNDPFSASTPDAFLSQNTQDPFSATGADNDPFTSTPNPLSTPNTTGMPQSSASVNPMPPMPDANDIAPTRGSKIAQDYIKRQQTIASAHPAPTAQETHATQSNSLEMINLKLDAIKSQLETLNQRMQKFEHEPKKRW